MRTRTRILWLLLYAAMSVVVFLATKAKEYAEEKALERAPSPAPEEP
jgi:hypothetical protein